MIMELTSILHVHVYNVHVHTCTIMVHSVTYKYCTSYMYTYNNAYTLDTLPREEENSTGEKSTADTTEQTRSATLPPTQVHVINIQCTS